MNERTLYPLRLGFLASHGGTDMKGIIKALHEGELIGKASVVISNNSDSDAMRYAREITLPNYHISGVIYPNPLDEDVAIHDTLNKHEVTIVILSGYMKKIGEKTLEAFPNRIINVHPALLPKYIGIYGDNVHKAVLQSGDSVTGVTIHTINENYDEGPTLLQDEVPVFGDDTIESLRKRVQAQEVISFINVLKQIQTGERRL